MLLYSRRLLLIIQWIERAIRYNEITFIIPHWIINAEQNLIYNHVSKMSALIYAFIMTIIAILYSFSFTAISIINLMIEFHDIHPKLYEWICQYIYFVIIKKESTTSQFLDTLIYWYAKYVYTIIIHKSMHRFRLWKKKLYIIR